MVAFRKAHLSQGYAIYEFRRTKVKKHEREVHEFLKDKLTHLQLDLTTDD